MSGQPPMEPLEELFSWDYSPLMWQDYLNGVYDITDHPLKFQESDLKKPGVMFVGGVLVTLATGAFIWSLIWVSWLSACPVVLLAVSAFVYWLHYFAREGRDFGWDKTEIGMFPRVRMVSMSVRSSHLYCALEGAVVAELCIGEQCKVLSAPTAMVLAEPPRLRITYIWKEYLASTDHGRITRHCDYEWIDVPLPPEKRAEADQIAECLLAEWHEASEAGAIYREESP